MAQENWDDFEDAGAAQPEQPEQEDWGEFEDAEDNSRGRLVKEFNRGVFEDLGLLPTNLINIGSQAIGALSKIPIDEGDPNIQASLVAEFGITPEMAKKMEAIEPPQIPTEGYKEFWRDLGWTPEEGDETEGIAEWAFRFSGSSFPALAMISNWGNAVMTGQRVVGPVVRGAEVLPTLKQAGQLGVGESLAVSTAANPAISIVGETAANLGAAIGGEAARQGDAPESVVAMAELLGAFAPAVFLTMASKASIPKALGAAIKRLAPAFTKAGGERRAAKRVQEQVSKGTPREAADKIDVGSKESPARQTEDEGLLALEKRILQDEPELKKQIEDTVIDLRARDAASLQEGEIDVGRVRQLLIKGKNYLLDLLDIRALKAAKDLDDLVKQMGPDVDERDLSRATREIIDGAYDDARVQEAQLWGLIDSSADVPLANGQVAYRRLADARSVWDDPTDVPAYVRKAFGTAEEQLIAIKEQLGISPGDKIPEAVLKQIPELQGYRFTFNDAKAIRSRMLDDIRSERAAASPNRNKIRILNEIANGKINKVTGELEAKGIIDDMADSGIEGVDTARDFSRMLNDKFTKGRVGRLMGFDSTGAQRISDAETLDYLLGGRDAAVTIDQFVNAAPETTPMVQSYLKGKFLAETVNPDGSISARTANLWIRRWQKKGAFEAFPEMEAEMRAAIKASNAATSAGARSKKTRSASRAPGKSRVAFYLNSDPGFEMANALNSRRPLAVLRSVVSRVMGDPLAMQELRYSFLDEALRRSHSTSVHSDGTPMISGRKFTDFWESHSASVRALEFSPQHQARIEGIATRLRRYDLKAGDAPKKVVDDIQSDVLDWIASYVGARAGGKAGTTMGSGLVMAGRGASTARKRLYRLLRNHAKETLVRASDDPALYKALLTKGLLAENTILQGNAPLTKAEETFKAYLIAIGAANASDFEEQN